MSIQHPIIAITGSSGAGTTSVKRTFEQIFRREGVNAVYIEGDAFHRYNRAAMRHRMSSAAAEGNNNYSHFGDYANLLGELEAVFREYAETGGGRTRHYIHDEADAELYGVPAGDFTDWEPFEPGSDVLFYEGLHGAVVTDTVDTARYVDLKIGVVPVINLEWIQKLHRDRSARGYDTEAVTDTILRRMPDYINFICPQFSHTDINFQRVPTVDTSNPFTARWIPTPDESIVVIRFKDPAGIDFPYLLSMISGGFMSRANSICVPGGKLELAMQLILTPMIMKLVERRRREPAVNVAAPVRASAAPRALSGTPARRRLMANAVRFLAVDAIEAAQSGHPGMPMGMADVAAVLFDGALKFDPAAPDWPDRDRFVLSAGHGSMLLYAVLHLTGYPGVDLSALKRFRQLDSLTPGHPEHGHTPGVETTTGPLGQGLATAVGMAIAERMTAARFGEALCDHRTYVIAGDGCLMEGVSQEAADLAGHLQLGRLTVLWDDNGISIDGPTRLTTSTDQLARFRACGWHVQAVDGHDPAAVARALARSQRDPRPSFIACRTTIGFGAPTKAGSEGVHGAPLGAAEAAGARAGLDWPHEPFEIPLHAASAWRAAAARGAADHAAWRARLAASPDRARFEGALDPAAPEAAIRAALDQAAAAAAAGRAIATRKASEETLGRINAATDRTIGGSADLTHSNLTLTPGLGAVDAKDFGGRYLHYGVREHAMAAVMNGIALHGGFIPYGGTFLVFSDYARGALRLSALMRQRVIYVFTHDSIGLGEDGPTHQPVEHLASLRAIPGLMTFRPADAVETAECWAAALAAADAPSALCLSRQALPTLRREGGDKNRSARGAYVLREARGPRRASLLATGSEVSIAQAAADQLAAEGLEVAVVSMPCWSLFERQDAAYRQAVLGEAPRIGVEAALRFGWDRWIGPEGAFVGMTGFGASAPADALYARFAITPTLSRRPSAPCSTPPKPADRNPPWPGSR